MGELKLIGKSGTEYTVRVSATAGSSAVGCHSITMTNIHVCFLKLRALDGAYGLTMPTAEQYDDLRSNPDSYKAILDEFVRQYCYKGYAHYIFSTNIRLYTTNHWASTIDPTNGKIGTYNIWITWDFMQMIRKLKYGAFTFSHVTGNRTHPQASMCVTMVWTPPKEVESLGAASPWRNLKRKGLLSLKEFTKKYLQTNFQEMTNCGIGSLDDTIEGCTKYLKSKEIPK